MQFTGRARVNRRAPQAFGVCDNCGIWYNHCDLVEEKQWQGNALRSTGFLVCTVTCYDEPQPQLMTPILPADPYPILNPRPELNTSDASFELASSGDPASTATPAGGLP
jgi:hypothetical protein